MFDIIKFRAGADGPAPSSSGFEKLYHLDEIKSRIAEAENLSDAAEKFKNRKTLIILKDHSMDDGAMRLIAEKGSACFLIDLGRLMKTRGVPRAIAISKLRNFLALCVKYNAFYSFATFAESESQLRSPGEMEHIAMLLGISRGQAKFALKMIGNYV